MFDDNTTSNRPYWEFSYSAAMLANAAETQKTFREGRVKFWQDAKNKLMAEIRESGVEISESAGANSFDKSYHSTRITGPQVTIRTDLQQQLAECHMKIQQHQMLVNEYDGWLQVFTNNSGVFVLKHDDWLYFFGKK